MTDVMAFVWSASCTTAPLMLSPQFIGIQIAKADFVVTRRPDPASWTATNDAVGIGHTVTRLRAIQPRLIVMEAAGGHATALVAALATAGLPVVIANPRQVRDFGRSTGRLAKTDRLDAEVLALFAERVQPTPRPLPTPARQQLDALVTRRRQLIQMLTAERNRLTPAAPAIRPAIRQHIRWLELRVGTIDHDLDNAIQQSPAWRATENLLRSVPGVGPVVSRTLLARLPARAAPSQASHRVHRRGAAGAR
jgi:transposase